ncbi:MAG: hypothetical protein R3B70_29375 [Polyangiaceae bacterium]
MVWRVESTGVREELAEELTAAALNGEKLSVFGPGGQGKTGLLLDVAKRSGSKAIVLRVPLGLDQPSP